VHIGEPINRTQMVLNLIPLFINANWNET